MQDHQYYLSLVFKSGLSIAIKTALEKGQDDIAETLVSWQAGGMTEEESRLLIFEYTKDRWLNREWRYKGRLVCYEMNMTGGRTTNLVKI